MIQPTVSLTLTWIHHVLNYELHTATRFRNLLVAILMTVKGIRVALDLDLTTARSFSMTLLTVSQGLVKSSKTMRTQSQVVGACDLQLG